MKCVVCNCEVIPDRVQFLLDNNKEMTCLEHSHTVKPKALYSGEYGTSELIFCDRVYNDSVRSKLYNAEQTEEEDELEETVSNQQDLD